MVLLEEAAEEEARLYEFAILYPSSLSQKEEQEVLRDVTTLIEEAGGKFRERDVWSTRGLAYPICGHREGKFLILHYTIDPARVREVDQQLRIMKGVLRHLVLMVRSAEPMVKFSERYDLWLKEEDTKDRTQKTEREEHVRRQIADRARRQANRPQKKIEHTEVKEEQITEQIQKIITDKDIDV
ncbi:30S ribosomal protein S6 [Candidatus Peribacteria bacterium RIFCSPLOWO2_12_FULL_55_15]|nr:MAG: 30S ribosomal protein S6 [Candidatus Peribacteria bacterium RIFCSPHIGHO2_01_FULL_54_22]OGJ63234.1 MAG: 30S ribosomal protein S6 [Candidatus Peribacteria bacterium RIFCSPHIGHO2_02_FULL_55_24]OGJ65111.1 MAG: 30S ribosomal protein S6 [Candidatus Peribacteria bacterium RIFCSPHIGHO2_12_FULL_54_10]OGJ68383.1 MAG: 30S ribosomal protein S6 [Candidatus Peribacteria bacterium RIFCSPLOWO2_01_FULL_54_110]OGJ70034.1 MAG: 30S ribosomal protein S6 [Candidatus Peribacteria bacterium RIFCSPLOWO2_02_FULL